MELLEFRVSSLGDRHVDEKLRDFGLGALEKGSGLGDFRVVGVQQV